MELVEDIEVLIGDDCLILCETDEHDRCVVVIVSKGAQRVARPLHPYHNVP